MPGPRDCLYSACLAGTPRPGLAAGRHSFASRALALGESLTMIGKLLGHTKIQTTARYAHLARDSIKLSAARVAASIGADILPAGARPDTC